MFLRQLSLEIAPQDETSLATSNAESMHIPNLVRLLRTGFPMLRLGFPFPF